MEDINSFVQSVPNFFSEGMLNSIFSPEFTGILLFVKIIFIIVSAVLLINIFYLLALSSWFSDRYAKDWEEFRKFNSIDAQKISGQWQEIDQRMKTKKETECKLAVLEAEESLIGSLKMMGHSGDILEEQLKQAGYDDLTNINNILEAHKIRNDIINNPEGKLDFERAERAVNIFKEAFEQLQA